MNVDDKLSDDDLVDEVVHKAKNVLSVLVADVNGVVKRDVSKL